MGTSQKRLKDLIRKLKLKVLMIAEPMLSKSRLPLWCHRLWFDACAMNEDVGGKIWLFWKLEASLVIQDMGDQFMTVKMIENACSICLTIIYAKCIYQERR